MTGDIALGIDIGTTSTEIVALDAEGHIAGVSSARLSSLIGITEHSWPQSSSPTSAETVMLLWGSAEREDVLADQRGDSQLTTIPSTVIDRILRQGENTPSTVFRCRVYYGYEMQNCSVEGLFCVPKTGCASGSLAS